ncbi:MAG: STAS domain-containing protein [Pirellulaceae bacterium]|nr:STAS domain-containing protein [Pirellulaceae bacterium]
MADAFEHIRVDEQAGVLLLTVLLERVTEYDLARSMEQELMDAVKQRAAIKVIVDLGKVEMMSSVGYLPYVGLRAHVKDAGGRLVLCNLSQVIREMFDMARLLINRNSPKAPFEYADSVDEALQMLTQD